MDGGGGETNYFRRLRSQMKKILALFSIMGEGGLDIELSSHEG
jgi:hypothetical protein